MVLDQYKLARLNSSLRAKVNAGVQLVSLREKVNRILDEASRLAEYEIDVPDDRITAWLEDVNSSVTSMRSESIGIVEFEVADELTAISEAEAPPAPTDPEGTSVIDADAPEV